MAWFLRNSLRKNCRLTLTRGRSRIITHQPLPRQQQCLRQSRKLSSSAPQQQTRKWPVAASIMIVPVMFVAWGVSDSIFGNRQVEKNENLRQEFLSQNFLAVEMLPVICLCVVRRNTGFTHCLSGVQIGDVVEVLQEGVGPDRMYNLVRLPTNADAPMSTDIYGWFPTRMLQKMDDYDKMVQEQLKELELE